MSKAYIDNLRLKHDQVKVMPLTTGEDLHWVRCIICKTRWVAVQEEVDEASICYLDKCQNSFEAKVARAVTDVRG